MGYERNTYNPDYCIHPGEYLEEVLDAREIRKKDFAQRAGISVKAVSQIINGKALFSPDVALQFEKVLAIKAEIWMNLMRDYQLFTARKKERERLETDETRSWLEKYPIQELIELEILPDTDETEALADNLLRFMHVSSPEVCEQYIEYRASGFQKDSDLNMTEDAAAIWIRLAEIEAEQVETQPFDAARFKRTLRHLRESTTKKLTEYIPSMITECAEAGIAFVLVPGIQQSPILGTAWWPMPYTAILAISRQIQTNDQFWFSFFHGAAHILLHSKKETFIDLNGESFSPIEKEADQFASEYLIPQEGYREFIRKPFIYKEDIIGFAGDIAVHPALVLRRLQYDEIIPFYLHNELKEDIDLQEL